MTNEKKRRYPMPCPGCRKMIDALDHLCPHCGVDTDAKLQPLRAIFPLVAVALALGLAILFRSNVLAAAVLAGLAFGLLMTRWRAPGRRP